MITTLAVIFTPAAALIAGYQLHKYLTSSRLDCFHHEVPNGSSHIRLTPHPSGRQFSCVKCEGKWFT